MHGTYLRIDDADARLTYARWQTRQYRVASSQKELYATSVVCFILEKSRASRSVTFIRWDAAPFSSDSHQRLLRGYRSANVKSPFCGDFNILNFFTWTRVCFFIILECTINVINHIPFYCCTHGCHEGHALNLKVA